MKMTQIERMLIMKKAKSFLILILVIIIILSSVVQVSADNLVAQTIRIYNADGLKELSKNCTFDRWSQGKTVILEADIDLNNEAFTPIPIFSGIFDGNGHTIRGLYIEAEGSNQGLFRYLQEGGTIKSLNVKGMVTPKGDKSTIGAVVGHNSGVVENCRVSAYIKGRDTVGGIAGWNGTSGKIINSSFSGTVYGESKAGGITGYNAGTILRCTNESSVNTTVEESELDFQNMTIEDINLERLISDAMDTGGIAGISTGIVMNSVNKGTIGYPSVGYNVGGIAGRQSGYINDCVNYGTVYGRKEVGGIAGQMDPYVDTIISPSKLGQLQREMNVLQSSMTRMMNNTKSASNLMTQNFSRIQGNIDDSMIHMQSLADQTEDMINKDIEGINTISVTALESLDRLIPIMESIENTMDIMNDGMAPIKRSLRYLLMAMDELTDIIDEFNEMSDSTEGISNEMAKAIENIDLAVEELEGSLEIIIKVISQDEVLKETFEDLKEELQKDMPNMVKVLEYIDTLYERLQVISEELNEDEISKKLDTAYEHLVEAGKNIENVMGELEGIGIGGHISEVFASMADALSYTELALAYMLDAMDIMERAQDDTHDIFDGIIELLEYISNQPGFEFQTTDDLYQKTKDELFTSIGSMSESLSEFMDDMSLQGSTMMDDLQSVSNQLFKVMNLLISIFTDLSFNEEDLENIVQDVSGEDIDKATEGKVSDSRNLGTVEGDINVGGIAGAMSIEWMLDPEDDFEFKDSLTANTVFQTRATVSGCVNEGSIISKKNNAGGIVGSMDLGYIKNCLGAGSIESTAGNYVGGIAGISNGPIVSSYAKCSLQGGNYIGGISGFGKEIIDSYTLVKVNESKACVGAIAGDIHKSSNIKGNYFVSDLIHGIDGISYAEIAEPIDYDMLISKENLPSAFKEFKLTFWAEDKLIKSIDFTYGESISENDLPEIPLKAGYHGKWEDFDISNLTFDAEIRALYVHHVTVLESKEKRDEVLPVILVEGKFTEEDSLTLTKVQVSPGEEGVLEEWNIVIPDDGEDTHIIRYYPKEGKNKLRVYIFSDGTWNKADTEWDGKYLVFAVEGNYNISVKVIDGGFYFEWIWASLAGIAALILIVIIVWVKKARSKKKASAEG